MRFIHSEHDNKSTRRGRKVRDSSADSVATAVKPKKSVLVVVCNSKGTLLLCQCVLYYCCRTLPDPVDDFCEILVGCVPVSSVGGGNVDGDACGSGEQQHM